MDEQYESKQDLGDEFIKEEYFLKFIRQRIPLMLHIAILDFTEICVEKIGRYHFATLWFAFDFYLKYSKYKGFSTRKSTTFKNNIGEKYYMIEYRRKEPRLETRTACEA
ncbi:hypothetical protein Ahy_B01g053099 [Arachis hypogaea]|uniref:FAR1 domain-containing protein n=1 Tax=Arachis hypogaea TaxID=3818 RepID=A0A445AR47_ARAHY|nr:hypothetical protein Ahy_B01g053099 [Arachis hypogaea]